MMNASPELFPELLTVRDFLRYAVSRFNEARLCFGHGTDNAYDEAAYLILHSLHLPIDRLEPFLDARLTAAERQAVAGIIDRRVTERIPAAYLTNEAWLGDFRFYVDERVIVPRSFFAELLENGLAPWIVDPDAVTHALDLCTGSACLAILMAHVYPYAHVDAIDISSSALSVAQRNVSDYALQDRVSLIESDLFAQLQTQKQDNKYDIILSNPPYVTEEALRNLPSEYQFEPSLALGAGADGMDIVRRIIQEAKHYLKPNGILAIEVGHNREYVERAFPRLNLMWLDTNNEVERVFLVRYEDLPGGII